MPTSIASRMPRSFPWLFSTLVAFAVSIKPAMTLPTLPAESGLRGIPPWLAILSFTLLGSAFGLLISSLLARHALSSQSAHRKPTVPSSGLT